MTEPIDLSELDPTRDARFDALVQRVAARAAERAVRPTLMTQIALAWRFALAGAAGIAIACWAFAATRQPTPPSAREALMAWAAHDDPTSRATLLASLEVPDER